MNHKGHRRKLARLIALLIVAGVDLVAADQPEGKEDILALPKFSVTAYVSIVKVAEYHMHEKRDGAAAVLSGWYIYIIGGQSSHGKFVRLIERFDVQTGESKVFSGLAVGRLWPRAVIAGTKVYIFGGESGRPVGHHGDTLRAGATQSAEARIADAERDDRRSGADPGSDELHPEASVEVLDMQTGALSVAGKMPDPRSEFGCVYLDGSIYVIGGKHLARHADMETVTNRIDVFNPGTGAWTHGSNMPVTSTADACVVDGAYIISAGGYNGSGALDSVFVFDPKTSMWSSFPPLGRPTSAHATVFLEKYLFLFGDYNHPEEILVYNLRDKTSSVFTLQYEASRHAAAVANAKRIFVIGGIPDRTAEPLDTIQVFQLTPKEDAAPKK